MELEQHEYGANDFERILPTRPLRVLYESREYLGLSGPPIDPVEVSKLSIHRLLKCKDMGKESVKVIGLALQKVGVVEDGKGWCGQLYGSYKNHQPERSKENIGEIRPLIEMTEKMIGNISKEDLKVIYEIFNKADPDAMKSGIANWCDTDEESIKEEMKEDYFYRYAVGNYIEDFVEKCIAKWLGGGIIDLLITKNVQTWRIKYRKFFHLFRNRKDIEDLIALVDWVRALRF